MVARAPSGEAAAPAFAGLGPWLAWAQGQSLSVLTLVGALSAETMRSPTGMPPRPDDLGMTPVRVPRHADLLVVIGWVSQKMLPHLLRTHAALARPSYVLHLRGPGREPPGYALVADLDLYLPVDVLVTGALDDDRALQEGLAALRDCIRRRGESP